MHRGCREVNPRVSSHGPYDLGVARMPGGYGESNTISEFLPAVVGRK